jgi:hypothetical protein
MSTVLSHEAFHPSVGFAFDELLLLEQMSRLPPDSIIRLLQSIPEPMLRDALAARAPMADASAPRERRLEPRRKVLRGARVTIPGEPVREVQVRDISTGGCRIWSRHIASLPDRFTIRIVGIAGERRCEVRWRYGEELGVRFRER